MDHAGDGDSSSRTVLDAFFLGKAVAEALNERIESTVGEFLSTVGRLQAEQQKQVQDFQVRSSLSCKAALYNLLSHVGLLQDHINNIVSQYAISNSVI